jgi:hypothetical protein
MADGRSGARSRPAERDLIAKSHTGTAVRCVGGWCPSACRAASRRGRAVGSGGVQVQADAEPLGQVGGAGAVGRAEPGIEAGEVQVGAGRGRA